VSADRKVLAFIKENPGVTPREISDALGIPYSMVRSALMRLREAGYLIRSSRGGYVVRAALPSGLEDELGGRVSALPYSLEDLKDIISSIQELKDAVKSLERKVEKLEKELDIIKRGIKPVEGQRQKFEGDRFLKTLFEEKVVEAHKAVRLTAKPVETYVRSGKAVIVGNLVVLRQFLENFKQKFPLRFQDIKNLSKEERALLDAMVKEGMVYLYSGREYRLIES